MSAAVVYTVEVFVCLPDLGVSMGTSNLPVRNVTRYYTIFRAFVLIRFRSQLRGLG